VRKKDYWTLARLLHADIANPKLWASELTQDEYETLRARKLHAASMARYLAEHLTFSPAEKAGFLDICGLKTQ
jgi:hypothetical protein